VTPRPRTRLLIGALAAAAAGLLGPAAALAACPATPESNGTGYSPPAGAQSLPESGPEILHRPLATSPQLENTRNWDAPPIMVSGSTAYRSGEFLYQDFLYDDRALTYPDEPQRYAGNAADIVEVRIESLADATALRVTFNSMLDPNAVAVTVALGDGASRAIPHGAGAAMPAEVFVTVHGCSGDIVRASDGARLDVHPTVVTDLHRRQLHIEVPHSVFDPRGRAVRVGAAAGLWDSQKDSYLRPDPLKPAFFNVAFREYGAWTQNTWMDQSQNEALSAGDLSPLRTIVDFRKLAARVDDDSDVPSTGPMNRIHVSHFEPAQGRGNNTAAGGVAGDFACDPPACTHEYSGRLQPYSVYVPDRPMPKDGYGLVVNLHGASSNHNHFEGGGPVPPLTTWKMLAEAGHPSIMAMPNARGQSYFYHGLAAADVFEMWADVAAHYRLDPGRVIQTGSSMGGYGTYKLGSQFPDLYTGLFPNVGPSSAVAAHAPPAPSLSGDATDVWRMFASLRHVPVLAGQNIHDPVVPVLSTGKAMSTLDELGYRYDYWYFTADPPVHSEYRHYLRDAYHELSRRSTPIVRDPRRVTHVLNGAMSDARYGLEADHVYWVSGLRLADAQAGPPLGTIDVTSRAIDEPDPEPAAAEQTVGPSLNGSAPYLRVARRWREGEPRPPSNAFTLKASNLKAATLDVRRMTLPEFGAFAASIETDAPLTLRLLGAFGAATRVTAGGVDQRVRADGASAVLELPSGISQLRVTQPPPIVLSRCAGRRTIRVRVRAPRGDRLRVVRIDVNGKRVRTVRGRALRGAIRIRVTRRRARVRVVATTREGRRLVRRRTYSSCR